MAKTRFRRFLLTFCLTGFIFILFFGIPFAVGCTNVITPPRNLTAPHYVYLLDYGKHSSLLLPSGNVDGNRHFTEYAYGEWEWYAKQEDGICRVIPTLFWPTTGTLGRNTWTLTGAPPSPPSTSATGEDADPGALDTRHRISAAAALHFNAEEVFAIAVESATIESLLDTLDNRFTAGATEKTPVHSEAFNLYFVPEPGISYSLFHNCNHEILDWLRMLGCTIKGNGIFADYRVKSVPAANHPG